MNRHCKYCLIITAIAAVITMPSAICYYLYANHSASIITSEIPDTEDIQHINDSRSDNFQRHFTILIDPGHGGFDPGKVSSDGIQEKDINLEISLKLRDKLLEQGFSVFLTRETDCSLNTSDSNNPKMSDLHYRTSRASEVDADLYISIHQNSYSAEYVHGAQVFYYSTSNEGKILADCIQNMLISEVDPDNSRQAKGSSDYLVLTESPCTSVIVECGFLSNAHECQQLCTPEYQDKIASAIAKAVETWQRSRRDSRQDPV